MKAHVVFLKPSYLRRMVEGSKRYEVRCSFRRLACEGVEEGDTLLLKMSGGEVQAACDVGRVRVFRNLSPEQVADIAREYAADGCGQYFRRYVPPNNRSRAVNVAVIELVDVRCASLPPDRTPRGARSGWVTLGQAGRGARRRSSI